MAGAARILMARLVIVMARMVDVVRSTDTVATPLNKWMYFYCWNDVCIRYNAYSFYSGVRNPGANARQTADRYFYWSSHDQRHLRIWKWEHCLRELASGCLLPTIWGTSTSVHYAKSSY
ncbi:hypothetical protein ABVK25_006260 [Lepraria finkii]|uniref:Secreted protein n=1 Tax=Lepraria finkii TaxID=1340010 RepID=A0ABR4B6W7_9LECA